MTLSEIIADACERARDSSPAARLRFRTYLNEWHTRLIGRTSDLRLGEVTLDVADTARDYTISGVSRVHAIVDANGQALTLVTPKHILELDPSGTSAGPPSMYCHMAPTTVRFYPYPDDDYAYTVQGDIDIVTLDDAADVPIIEKDFHWLLVYGILINEFSQKEDKRAQLLEAKEVMREGRADMAFFTANKRYNSKHKVRGWRGSRLGPGFPAGT